MNKKKKKRAKKKLKKYSVLIEGVKLNEQTGSLQHVKYMTGKCRE
jgi:hypothetical protein